MSFAALMVSIYNNLALRARIKEDMSEVKLNVLEIETKLQDALTHKLNAAIVDIRQSAQNDALELVQNSFSSMQDGGYGDPLGMANFSNFGE